MTAASGLHRHANALLSETFDRRRGRLGSLAPARRDAVEEAARRAVTASVDAVLVQALEEPALAAALLLIYGAPERAGLRLQSHRVS